MTDVLEKPRLRRNEAAAYLDAKHGLRVAPKTLARYASEGGGPKFQRFGHIPYYTPSALDLWVEGKLSPEVASTSEEAAA
ncbi:MAG: hypothetical protein RIB57_13685 [Pelagibacterium sp.]|uniref:hypothetical protein n=1 Tax=Pelagibacterium sp. TaxID=1967288 RepID=UPI0032EEA853